MITNFPQFQKLKLADKKAVEQVINKFEPYSDFNFTSLFCWNTDDSLEISILNQNLVIKMPDYTENNIVLSFIGITDVDDTIAKILEYCRNNSLEPKLKLIPEKVVQAIKNSDDLLVKEDPSNHDYILSAQEISSLASSKYKSKRHQVSTFERNYPKHKLVEIDLSDDIVKKQISDLLKHWIKTTEQSREHNDNERIAIERVLKHAEELGVVGIGCYIKDKLVGFSIFEVASKEYGIIAFEKANKSHAGVYAILNREEGKYFKKMGCKFINIEQDLGVEAMRDAKQKWRPVKFLKKYTIKPKKTD